MNFAQYASRKPHALTHYVKIALAVMMTLGLCGAVHAGAVNANANAALKEINLLAEQGKQAAALDKVNVHLATHPKDAEALFMKGVILVEMGKRNEAINTFVDLTAKYPHLPEPYNNLAVLYADQGQYDKARLALETAIKTHPSYATAHENLGDIYARLASEAYDKAFKLDTSNGRAQNKLSMITNLFGAKSTAAVPAPLAVKAKPAVPVVSAATAQPAPVKEPATVKEPAISVTAPAVAIKPVEATKLAPVTAAANQQEAILEAVNAWAKAWSEQNVSQYLASYADSFKTPKGEARKSWENTRRQRIQAPKNISVQVSKPEVTLENDSLANVRFYQTYRADGKPQSTTKTLTLTKQNNAWLITQEMVGR